MITTSVTIRKRGIPTRLLLRREYLNGLEAWAVFKNAEQIGWVLNRMERPEQWACVPMPVTEEDKYESTVYDYQTRREALGGLLPDDKE